MKIQKLVKILTDSGISEQEAKREISMLLEHFCNYTEKDKILRNSLSEGDFKKVEYCVNKRVNEKLPVQYIIGKAWFMGEYYKVSSDVLIPRDETEISVREAINIIKAENFKTVLDVGTGSGCIACSIAKNTNAVVLGVDISLEALRIALDNVTDLEINNKAVFRKSDLFEKIHPDEKFDLIISNPPYIPVGTKLDEEVLKEPKIALFAPNNGLYYYFEIIKNAPKYLNKNGYLVFELGIGESDEVLNKMKEHFNDIKIIKDLAGIDRVITGKIKN